MSVYKQNSLKIVLFLSHAIQFQLIHLLV